MTMALMVAALVAGCADGGDEGPVDPVDPGAGEAQEQQYVRIGGETYACDDTIRTDAACEEYVLTEDAPEDATVDAEAQPSEDGSVTLDGQRYVCDDTKNVDVDVGGDSQAQVGACESYVLAGEA